MKVKYTNKLEDIPGLSDEKRNELEKVTEKFAFRSNSYYNSLINWEDANDPLRRIIEPIGDELLQWGELDASSEIIYQPVKGLEHKYRNTALLLCNDVCAAYCRFCFRKRLFQDDNDEVVKDVSPGIEYIRNHPEINNVLLTGGDPMVMSTSNLKKIIDPLLEIEHVKNIRIGTKVPAFNPYRITEDASLHEAIRSVKEKKIYIMAHFNHSRELTPIAIQALDMLRAAGAGIVNQTPIIAGVNDSAQVLAELFNKLSFIGIQTYYVFACRPTLGNKTYSVPLEKAIGIFNAAIAQNSGLAKTARFVLSHKIGKIELLGVQNGFVLFKYHNVVDASRNGEILVAHSNKDAYWFDDYDNFLNLSEVSGAIALTTSPAEGI